MILLDADVLLIRLRFRQDPKAVENDRLLDLIRTGAVAAGVLQHTLLETVGMLSFNTASADIAGLYDAIPRRLNLTVIPAPTPADLYAGLTVDDVRDRIALKMSFGDAVAAAQVTRFVPAAAAFLTWNAKHFVGKLPVPVLTPAEWLAARPATP